MIPAFVLAAALQATTPAAPPAAASPEVLIPPATIDNSLEITGEALAARQIRTRMTVEVKVDGRGPYRFLVDSGADRSAIGTALAQSLALPAEDTVLVHSMAGVSQVPTVRVGQLEIGATKIPAIVAPVLPERFIGAQGLLGIDALVDQRLLLDFDRKTITVQDTHRAAVKESGEIVVTARRRKGQLILTQVTAGRVPVYAVIDSGSDITLGNEALRRRIFRHPEDVVTTRVTLVSVTGDSFEADLARMPEFRIGGLLLANVEIAFADAPPFALFGLDKQPAVMLGTDMLQAFKRVSLDFRNRKVRFVPR